MKLSEVEDNNFTNLWSHRGNITEAEAKVNFLLLAIYFDEILGK